MRNFYIYLFNIYIYLSFQLIYFIYHYYFISIFNDVIYNFSFFIKLYMYFIS